MKNIFLLLVFSLLFSFSHANENINNVTIFTSESVSPVNAKLNDIELNKLIDEIDSYPTIESIKINNETFQFIKRGGGDGGDT